MAIGSVCLAANAPAAHLDRCSKGGGLEKLPVIIRNQACSRDTSATRATSYYQRQCNLKAQRCRSGRLSGRRRWALARVFNSAAPEQEQEQVESKKESGKCVLVAGATGGVGQLVVAALLERGVQVRALLRDAEKARSLFGDSFEQLKVHIGDLRQPQQLDQSLFEGVTHVICCTGTTAFPSKRWDGDNGPENTDWIGVRNLIAALPKSIRKVVLVTSVGVTKYNELPWNIMNLFGVLKYKKLSEDFLQSSGLPYTIIRPGRLTDGPYTSYDLNTLLKATAGTRRAVTIGQGDKLIGEASRLVVAECCVQALDLDITTGQVYEVNSVEGEGPGRNPVAWESLFRSAQV